MIHYVGVDGCSGGWFAIAVAEDNQLHYQMFGSIDQMWETFRQARLILIDIPIGLPHWRNRSCDIEARKLLGRRGASVFPAPSRPAIGQADYEQASLVNYQVLGRKLSIQTWNIIDKIKQVDRLFDEQPVSRSVIRESHPEICFWALSGGKVMAFNKKTEEGIAERLNVLKPLNPFVEATFQAAAQTYRRKDLARDDILDALALAITAASPSHLLVTLPDHPEKDQKNLPMEMVFTRRFLSDMK